MLNFAALNLNCTFYLILILGALAASWGGNLLIYPYMEKRIAESKSKVQKESHPYAEEIGKIERAVYFLCVVVNGYILIAGWFALKAFSNYKGDAENHAAYHTYLIGNIYSLLIGLGTGVVMCGLIIAACSK